MLDLAIVMPTYNESECINSVVDSWLHILDQLDVEYKLIIINDGSTDNTTSALKVYGNNSNTKIIEKQNSGHGPTILAGYNLAVLMAEWVFQCDSDNEIPSNAFPYFWNNREKHDALLGVRTNRDQNISRKVISSCSRSIIKLFYGKKVKDVNIPFRLIRSEILQQIIEYIPDDTIAPNIIISGAISASSARYFDHPVLHTNRTTGCVSIVKWKLWRFAAKALWQTLVYRLNIKKNTIK